MSEIWFYKDFTSETTIQPSWHEPVTGGYMYYFVLYPTGLILRLKINTEANHNVLYYDYSTNTIMYLAGSLSSLNPSVSIASISKKTYQITGKNGSYNSVLRITEGNGNNSVYDQVQHYGWYYSTNYSMSINTSTGAIMGSGTVLENIQNIYFIESGLGVGIDLKYTNNLDRNRFPIYKSGNSYKKTAGASLTVGTTYTFLMSVGDCYSTNSNIDSYKYHERGYATRKDGFYNDYSDTEDDPKEGIADNVHQDNARGKAGRFGIKTDGSTTGTQYSVAPSLNFYDERFRENGTSSSSIIATCLPEANVSRNYPGKLGNKNENININTDIFGIDQFVLQIQTSQFKIPIGGIVHIYQRTGGTMNTTSMFKIESGGQGNYSPYSSYAINGYVSAGGEGEIALYQVSKTDTGEDTSVPYYVSNFNGSMTEYVLSPTSNSYTQQNTSFPTKNIRIDQTLVIDSTMSGNFPRINTALATKYIHNNTIYKIGGAINAAFSFQVVHDIKNIPYPPGFSAPQNVTKTTRAPILSGQQRIRGPNKELLHRDGGTLDLYNDGHPQTIGRTVKAYVGITLDVNANLEAGILLKNNNGKSSIFSDPQSGSIEVYTDSSINYNTTTISVEFYRSDNGNQIGVNVDLIRQTGLTDTKTGIVAYPNE